ncbi:hypothetical protein ACS5PU_02330 [Pedobacter sp. GSP4]|uniref:hypothetical protein n=1 Tax=Pedobacter sp. GSP4 TaxID=3453716 RepID=UPI003EE9BAF4
MSLGSDGMEKTAVKTAQQVLEAFYGRYGLDSVRLILLESFQAYALNDKKGFLELGISEEEVAEVFDGLIGLVGAVLVLMEEGRIDGLGPEDGADITV